MLSFFKEYFSFSNSVKGHIYLGKSPGLNAILLFLLCSLFFFFWGQKVQEQILRKHKTSPLVWEKQRFP